MTIAVVEESSSSEDFFGDRLESANDVLVSGFRGSGHVPGFVGDFLVRWKKLVEIVDGICEFGKEFGFSWGAFSRLNEVEDVDWSAVSFK